MVEEDSSLSVPPARYTFEGLSTRPTSRHPLLGSTSTVRTETPTYTGNPPSKVSNYSQNDDFGPRPSSDRRGAPVPFSTVTPDPLDTHPPGVSTQEVLRVSDLPVRLSGDWTRKDTFPGSPRPLGVTRAPPTRTCKGCLFAERSTCVDGSRRLGWTWDVDPKDVGVEGPHGSAPTQ